MMLTHSEFAVNRTNAMALFLATPLLATPLLAALFLAIWLISPAGATVTNDRYYEFGGTGSYDETLGANVGQGNPIGYLYNGQVFTTDQTGPASAGSPDLGGYIDLKVQGATSLSHTGSTYTDTSSRPLGVAGGYGAQFDGADDVLSAYPLDIPEQFASRLPPPATYPFNYTGIKTRGLQLWVRPNAAGLNAGVRQTIVMDTTESGGVAITADGKWTQIFDSELNDGNIPATVAVAPNTWYHVMQHIYTSGDAGSPALVQGADAGFTSVVYVDGVAVSASNDLPDAGDLHLDGRVGLLTVGAAELPDQNADPLTPEFGEYFDGTIDDLKLYVSGDNTSFGGQDYGTFDLFADNEWIHNEIMKSPLNGTLQVGDVNRDGAVTLAGDLPAFIAGWQSKNTLTGAAGKIITAGDWNTWSKGDMNHDGTVDLLDWAMINGANPSLGAAIAGALTAVPEPTSLVLFAMAGMLGAGRRLRQPQRRQLL